MQSPFHVRPVIVRFVADTIFRYAGAILLLWLVSVQAHSGQAPRDYLLPGEAKGGFVSSSSFIEEGRSSTKASSSFNYQAFDGTRYQLVENRGHYVNVLIPASFEEGPFFTEDHLEEMVDQLDILYAIYTDIIQGEPGGNDLLTVAFVPETCGTGCGMLGRKGVEILSRSQSYEMIIDELNAGRLHRLLLHEVAHNFDIFSDYLHYLPDHAHAWTEMFEYFAPYRYSRINTRGFSPDDLYHSPTSEVWKDYVTEQSANWNHCVRDDSCADMGMSANELWAMMYYRTEAMHGIEAILDSFEFLKIYTRDNPPPTSDEDKEDLRLLSLAAGSNTNISCYPDALKWPILPGTAMDMQNRYGDVSGLCDDLDQDGFSAVNGDCDDSNELINIAQPEVSGNGQDDDCDDLVDETSWIEADAGSAPDNFVDVVQTSLPFDVKGSIGEANDRDTFNFTLPVTGRIRVTLCAREGFRGWAVALQPNGRFLVADNWFSYRDSPGCTSNTLDFGNFATGGLRVIPNESMGDYTIKVSAADELLPDHSSLVRVISRPGNGMTLQVNDNDGLLSNLGTDEVEVWISGIAKRIFVPFDAGISIVLDRVIVPELRDGQSYQVRIRPRANGLPLAAFSAGHLFRYDPLQTGLPVLDHRFSGAWFDSTHDGEGFIIEVLEGNRATVYWFTYQSDGSQRWMFGIGSVEANRITVGDLLVTRGGRFGVDFNPDDVVMERAGTLSLSFLDCSRALVNYSVDNTGGQQNNSRLTQVYGHECGSAAPVHTSDLSGSWYDPSHNGEGFIVEQINPTQAVVVWFTYDDAGNQSWLLNSGSIDNGIIHVPVLHRPGGGVFGRDFNPDSVTRQEWGELTLELSCSGGIAQYTTQADGFSDGSQSLVRLTQLANSDCSDQG